MHDERFRVDGVLGESTERGFRENLLFADVDDFHDQNYRVVTSVPSDSPDDFMALSDLKSKEALRMKFNIKDEWVLPFEVIPIINIPGYGDASAPAVCEELKIKSQNDRQKLDEAKHRTYLKGFTDGVMIVGGYKGKPVKEVKPIIKQEMVDANTGLIYSSQRRWSCPGPAANALWR